MIAALGNYVIAHTVRYAENWPPACAPAERSAAPSGDERRGRIPGMVMINERPAEAEDRAVPGHWEGDLILGENGRSAVGTLVERSTRYCLLLHLPNGHDAESVAAAMLDQMARLPAHLRRSLVWDQSREMTNHAAISTALDMPIYFCEPHSPWMRGSNENTVGVDDGPVGLLSQAGSAAQGDS